MAVLLPKPQHRASGRSTETERAKYVSLFLAGYSPVEIGQVYRRDAEAIRQAIEDAGYKSGRYRTDDSMMEEWPPLYDKQDWTIAEIADAYNVGSGTVRYHLARLGVKIKHPAYYRGEKRKSKRSRKRRRAA